MIRNSSLAIWSLLLGCSGKVSEGTDATTSSDSAAPVAPVHDPHPHAVTVTWTDMGPTPAGELNAVTLSDYFPNRVYLGSEKSGLFRSDSWPPQFSRVATSPGISPHIMQPVVEIPDSPASIVVNCLYDIWLSNNGGESASVVSDLAGIASGVMSVAAQPGLIVVAEAGGNIWVTRDQFETIEFAGLVHWGVTSKDWVPDRPAVKIVLVNETVWLVSQRGGGIWRTEDMGLTWSPVMTQTVDHDSLEINDGHAFVATVDEILRSEDGGETWSPLDGSPSKCTQIAAALPQVGTVCEGRLWLSPDGGDTWTDTTLDAFATGIDMDDSRLIVGLSEGMAWSDDGGTTFEQTSVGLENEDIAHLAADPEDPDTLVAGTQCLRGFFRSEDQGGTWGVLESEGHYTMGLQFAPNNPSILYATDGDGVFRSDDGGMTLRPLSPLPESVVHPHGLTVHPTEAEVILVGTSDKGDENPEPYPPRLLRSLNGGESWTQIGAGLPEGELSFVAVAYDPHDPNRVWVGAGDGGLLHGGADVSPEGLGLYVSIDAGISFTQVEGLSDESSILDIRPDPINPGHVLVTTDNGLHRTTDGGGTWAVVQDAPGPVKIVWHPSFEDTIFGSHQFHTTVSVDGGETWSELGDHPDHAIPLPDGVGPASSSGLAISADGEVLYVGSGLTGGRVGTLTYDFDHPEDTGLPAP